MLGHKEHQIMYYATPMLVLTAPLVISLNVRDKFIMESKLVVKSVISSANKRKKSTVNTNHMILDELILTARDTDQRKASSLLLVYHLKKVTQATK